MAFNQYFISDRFDNAEALVPLYEEIGKLGFDRKLELPKTFAHYQVIEGFDRYDEIRQTIRVSIEMNNQPATVAFTFRAIQEEDEVGFKLNDVEAKLYITSDQLGEPVASRSFGRTKRFSTKEQMIKDLSGTAQSLSTISEVRDKFKNDGNAMIKTSAHNRQRH